MSKLGFFTVLFAIATLPVRADDVSLLRDKGAWPLAHAATAQL